MLFYDTALENPEGNRPEDLRSNIVNLAGFVFKRSLDILADPEKEKFDILIEINREVAAGLMAGARKDAEVRKEDESKKQDEQEEQPEPAFSDNGGSITA
jgi:flagellar protein FlaF